MDGEWVGRRTTAWAEWVPVERYGAATAIYALWAESHDGYPPRDIDTLWRWLRQQGKRLPALPCVPGSSGWIYLGWNLQRVTHQNSAIAWADLCLQIETTSAQARAGIARSALAKQRATFTADSRSSAGARVEANTTNDAAEYTDVSSGSTPLWPMPRA